MNTQTKSPVEIVQELIAIHTTRKEAAERFQLPEGEQAARQSDQFIAALMSELSDFGDGVQSVAERENDYQTMYKKILPDIDSMTPQQHQQAFQELEDKLKEEYTRLLETGNELPESIQTILTQQKEQL